MDYHLNCVFSHFRKIENRICYLFQSIMMPSAKLPFSKNLMYKIWIWKERSLNSKPLKLIKYPHERFNGFRLICIVTLGIKLTKPFCPSLVFHCFLQKVKETFPQKVRGRRNWTNYIHQLQKCSPITKTKCVTSSFLYLFLQPDYKSWIKWSLMHFT